MNSNFIFYNKNVWNVWPDALSRDSDPLCRSGWVNAQSGVTQPGSGFTWLHFWVWFTDCGRAVWVGYFAVRYLCLRVEIFGAFSWFNGQSTVRCDTEPHCPVTPLLICVCDCWGAETNRLNCSSRLRSHPRCIVQIHFWRTVAWVSDQ